MISITGIQMNHIEILFCKQEIRPPYHWTTEVIAKEVTDEDLTIKGTAGITR